MKVALGGPTELEPAPRQMQSGVRGKLELGLASALNLGSYFAFQLAVIQILGAGTDTDAFIASNTIPQLVIAVLGGSLGFVLVPVLATRPAARLRHDTWVFIYAIGLLFGLLSLALGLGRGAWVALLVPGFTPAQQALTAELAAIQLVTMPLSAVVAVQLAGQAAQHRFVRSELVQGLANLAALALLALLLPRHGVVAAAWIALLRLAAQCAGLARGLGPPRRVAGVRQVLATPWARLRPLLLGSAYYRTEPAIDRHLLSATPSGALTLYYLVEQVFSGIGQLFIRTLVSPTVPRLSVLFERRDFTGFSALYHRTVLRVFVPVVLSWALVVAGTATLLPWTMAALGSADAGWQRLWWLALLLGGTLVGGACGQIASAGFYASGDTMTVTRMSLINYTLYLPCKIGAFVAWGITGLAVCASVYAMNNFLMQVLLMRRKLRLLAAAGD